MKSSSDGKKTDRKKLEELFRKHGYEDFKWMDPQTIIPRHWVRDWLLHAQIDGLIMT